MTSGPTAERPVAIYLVVLYFVLAGFLESIKKYREWEGPLKFSPLADHSIWELSVDIIIYLALAYLIWHYAKLGRLAALVYGYLILGTYVGSVILYLVNRGGVPLTVTPLFVIVGVFHVVSVAPILWYLQPSRQKAVFHVSLIELLLESD